MSICLYDVLPHIWKQPECATGGIRVVHQTSESFTPCSSNKATRLATQHLDVFELQRQVCFEFKKKTCFYWNPSMFYARKHHGPIYCFKTMGFSKSSPSGVEQNDPVMSLKYTGLFWCFWFGPGSFHLVCQYWLETLRLDSISLSFDRWVPMYTQSASQMKYTLWMAVGRWVTGPGLTNLTLFPGPVGAGARVSSCWRCSDWMPGARATFALCSTVVVLLCCYPPSVSLLHRTPALQ